MNAIAESAHAPSVITDLARHYGMDRRAFESTLRNTIMPAKVEVTNEQLAAFSIVAKKYGLNPFTKEIYAFPAKGGGIQPIVSIDGWLKIINDHPQFDGVEFDDKFADQNHLTAVTCRIFRKDRARPVAVTEYMAECVRNTEPWAKWPARMLRHKAMIQAARYAFGFSGIVDPDEAERIEAVTAAAARAETTIVAMPRAKSERPAPPADIVEVVTPKCDGNHAEPRCADPECWIDGAPAEPREPGIFVSESLERILIDTAKVAGVPRGALLERYPRIDKSNYNAIRQELKAMADATAAEAEESAQ